MSKVIVQLSIRELFSGEARYVIPMYQRNYAWEEGEITQLIQDVIDYLPKAENAPQNYYIGTLVVYRRERAGQLVYETIDGQQRLTTLSLLLSYLKNGRLGDVSWYDQGKIDFESRAHSQKTFAVIAGGEFTEDPTETLAPADINAAILNGYQLIKKVLPLKLAENHVEAASFTNYLSRSVQIMRVEVPGDTDLNHYFEIMNNRGEQLEKHEVLKSRMLEVLETGIADPTEKQQSQACLHQVWEACANMEKYVQMGFPPRQRSAIFGERDWGSFTVSDFETLKRKIAEVSVPDDVADETKSLSDIIESRPAARNDAPGDDEASERFNTVINFPNFLLHVLRAETGKDIPLDDKRLLSTFDDHILKSNEDGVVRVKRFTFSLLKCKFLFDKYVIKREFLKGSDCWSLKRLKWSDGGGRNRAGRNHYANTFGDEDLDQGENRRILMLLAAFHVSTPTLVYKHWLNAALRHLFTATGKIEASVYLQHLESVARAFVFDRFLAGAQPLDYYAIIYKNCGVCQSQPTSINEDMSKLLSFGHIENNLVFNYLDYLLWLKHRETNPIVRGYEFTFRSSVEHYYPQHPLPGHTPLDAAILNSFGNLCLISHSKNSRLSNFPPEAKKEYYRNNTLDSVKQCLMMEPNRWDAQTIANHQEIMFEVLVHGVGETD